MPTVLEKTRGIKNKVINNFYLLDWQQQKEIAKEINGFLMSKRIEELHSSILPSNFSEDEIVAECRKARKERVREDATR